MYALADRFDISVSSVHACIERVLDFFNKISASVIAWPNQQQQERSKAGFLAKAGGKGPCNTIGCVDGCHVEINKPDQFALHFISLARVCLLECADSRSAHQA